MRGSPIMGLFLVMAFPAMGQEPVPSSPMPAPSAPAAAPAQPSTKDGYSVVTTTIGTLLDVPALRAILQKHLPEVVTHPQVAEGRLLTLPEVVQYAPDIITPEKLAAIDLELKAVPPQ